MTTLYVKEQGTTVRKKDNQLLVTRNGQVLEAVPLGKLEQVILMGRGVQMSTALLVELLQRDIPVMLTNQHGTRHYATIATHPSRFGALRLQQMARVGDADWVVRMAQGIIRAKLLNQRALLTTTNWPAAAASIQQIDAALSSLATAPTVDSVRGYEGSAAAAYFGAWRIAFQAEWLFHGRDFYPPPDPINAMLSFGYTLALHDVMSAVQFVGLDPYLGTFHTMEAGRPSLALDLLEEFRPLIVDRMVLDLVTAKTITRDHFAHPGGNLNITHLNEQGRTLVIDRYEQTMQSMIRLLTGEETTVRRALLLQVQAAARVIRGDQAQYVGVTP